MNRPKIVGIVNITEDSFFDGGKYITPQAALRHARKLVRDGADIVEFGAASSHPDAKKVSKATELKRLQPIIEAWKKETPLAIDSFQENIQQFAVDNKVAYLNDIHGFVHEKMNRTLASASCNLVIMHSIHGHKKTQKKDIPPEVIWPAIHDFFDKRIIALKNHGIAHHRMILDPGMGFFLSRNPKASLLVLATIEKLKHRYNLPVMVSVSRKSFLQSITNRRAKDTLPATLAGELWAAHHGVDFIRTHNVKALCDALKIYQACQACQGEFS